MSVTTLCCPFVPKDKKYASDKYKDIYTELSIVRAKADCDVSRLKEQLKAATEALGEKSPENPPVSGYGESCGSGFSLWKLGGGAAGPCSSRGAPSGSDSLPGCMGRTWWVPAHTGQSPFGTHVHDRRPCFSFS